MRDALRASACIVNECRSLNINHASLSQPADRKGERFRRERLSFTETDRRASRRDILVQDLRRVEHRAVTMGSRRSRLAMHVSACKVRFKNGTQRRWRTLAGYNCNRNECIFPGSFFLFFLSMRLRLANGIRKMSERLCSTRNAYTQCFFFAHSPIICSFLYIRRSRITAFTFLYDTFPEA